MRFAQKVLQHALYNSQDQHDMPAIFSVVNFECPACYSRSSVCVLGSTKPKRHHQTVRKEMFSYFLPCYENYGESHGQSLSEKMIHRFEPQTKNNNQWKFKVKPISKGSHGHCFGEEGCTRSDSGTYAKWSNH